MRSKAFEDELIHIKLQTTLNGLNNKRKHTNVESNGWTPERVLSKESLELIENILTLCRKPKTKAKIIHENNGNVGRTNDCIQYLMAQGLIADAGNLFGTTKNGEKLLGLLVRLRGFFGVDPLE